MKLKPFCHYPLIHWWVYEQEIKINSMKSVLLSGYYCFGNLADELMLKNIAMIFKKGGFSLMYAVSGRIEHSRAKSKCSGEFVIAKLPLKIICKLYEWQV